MYYVAVVCAHRHVQMPEGYGLSQAEREAIASKLVGVPITVQHANVKERVAEIPAEQTLSPALMQNTLDSCGMVIAAWVAEDGAVMAIFAINDGYKRVTDLISMRQLACVSLTHVENINQPIELTLCTLPARPGSVIVLTCADLKDAYAYKASTELQETSTDMEAKEKSPLAQILDGLNVDDRKLVEARFSEMMAAVDQARGEKATAEEKMTALKQMTEVDRTLMKTHLDQWRSAVNSMDGMDAQLKTYGLAVGDNGVDLAMEMLQKADSGVQHTVANIIKCASASMMARRTMPANPAVPETPVLKRKANVMDEVPDEAAPGCTPLERAMAAQFV